MAVFKKAPLAITLGVKARDKVTGFTGIVTGHCVYLYGCAQWCLVPDVDKDGKLREGQWFDEGRVEWVSPGIPPEAVRGEKPGGPQRDAPAAR